RPQFGVRLGERDQSIERFVAATLERTDGALDTMGAAKWVGRTSPRCPRVGPQLDFGSASPREPDLDADAPRLSPGLTGANIQGDPFELAAHGDDMILGVLQ